MTRNTAKRNAQSNETPSIVLKTIYDEHMNDNKNSTLTTKKMRARLRVEMRDVHIRNSSWIFTQSQRDVVRAMFDASFASRMIARDKRNAKTNARKVNVKTNDANVDANDNANVDA